MSQSSYALPNSWDLARRRLDLLEAAYDPASFRRADALGIRPGWRCLDMGAGGGSFTRWLAERVGERGSVVAADLDTRLLEGLAVPNMEVRRMDVTRDELEADAFDFVHTRLVLLHIPEREEVLRKLVRSLRPGGLILVEEDDVYPMLASATGDYRDGWDAFLAVTGQGGTDPEWARGLPEHLDRLGLRDVDATVDTQMFRGGSPPAEFWRLTWEQARDRTDADAIDRGRAALADPGRWFYGPAMVVAWGWRPGR